jgi:hypothetical protein
VDIGRYAQDGTTEEVKPQFLDRLLASRKQFSCLALPAVDFRFDSQENLDKNYHGSYDLYLLSCSVSFSLLTFSDVPRPFPVDMGPSMSDRKREK